jgi:subtilisin family serine protease
MSGTSMAAPFVSGAAAVLFSVRPQATPQQVKQALLKSVDLGPYKVISQGRLNLGKAVLELKKMVP